jgi:hypothetical protein
MDMHTDRERNRFTKPSDEVLNRLVASQGTLPVRWNIDQREHRDRIIYIDESNPDYKRSYTIRAPQLNDPRVVHVYYDVHPNELDQAEIGRSLKRDEIYGVRTFQINHAAPPGQRKLKYDMSLIFPGDINDRESSERRLAHTALESARLWNPDVAFELHNTPFADDGMIYMRRNVGRYVGQVAAYLSQTYDLPIVEATDTSLSGNFSRSMLVDMPLGDPRFSVDVWRKFLEDLIHNDIPLPDEPARPRYSFYDDIRKVDWLSVSSITEPIPSFSLIEDDIAKKLKLPLGVRAVNWIGSTLDNDYVGGVVVPFDENANRRIYAE